MSSSTSNFRRAFALACLVALFFGGLEAFTRRKLYRASKDLARFTTYPARARALSEAPGKRLAFLGNSLTERGVDAQLAAKELGVTADMFVADASHINTWIWMMQREFWSRDLSVDLLVVHFYENGLEDGKRLEVGRLAQFFTTRDDWGELFANDVKTLDGRAEFVVSTVWATYAVRDRIKERVLDLIPGYQDWLEASNQITFDHDRALAAAHELKRVPTRHALERFLARAQAHHTKVLFVAFPTMNPYDVPDETIRTIRDAGMLYLDLRSVPELDRAAHYADDIHLNEAGRAIYTRRLVAELRALHAI